jgi:hypothetical protein
LTEILLFLFQHYLSIPAMDVDFSHKISLFVSSTNNKSTDSVLEF